MKRRARWAPAIGAVTFLLLLTSTLLWFACLLPAVLLKALLPLAPARRACTRYLVWIGGVPWAGTNHLIYRVLHGPRRPAVVEGQLDPRRSWLIVSNHRSWADILLLVDALRGRAQFPRFFLKRELLWVPIVGLACWAMDMPFMRRHGRRAVAANPTLAHDDLEITRRACQRYRGTPVTVVNFVEGTRFSEAKRRARGSPYRHLLRPKCGGLAFAIGAMGDQFAGLVDVTLAYRPTRAALLWSFLCGEQAQATVKLVVRPLPQWLLQGDYQDDATFRARFQRWVNDLWAQKDAELDRLLH